MTHSPLTIDPGLLKLHPLLLELPGDLDSYKTGPLFDAICDHLLTVGAPVTPLPVVDGVFVSTLDAALWMFAARQCGIKEVPIYAVHDADAALVMCEMSLRLHYTAGQRAYLLWPLVAPPVAAAIAASRKRRAENFKNKAFSPSVHSVNAREITVEDFAHNLNLSRTIFFQAREVHALFKKHPDYKAVMEPKLLGPAEDAPGLGAIIAGHDGFKKTGSTRPEVNQLELFDTFGTKLFKHVPRGKLHSTADLAFARASEEKAEYLRDLGLALVEGYKRSRKHRTLAND